MPGPASICSAMLVRKRLSNNVLRYVRYPADLLGAAAPTRSVSDLHQLSSSRRATPEAT